MLKTRFILVALLLLMSIRNFSQYTDQINSNRPGESQGAFSVGRSIFHIEGGLTGLKEKHTLLFTETQGMNATMNFRWGILREQLEFNMDLMYQADQFTNILGTENRNGLRKTIIGAKYLIYDPFKKRDNKPNVYSWRANNKFKWNQFIPAVAVFAGANLNFQNIYTFSSDPIVSPKIMIIAQNQFSNGLVLVTNIISDKFTSDFPSYGYIITLTKGFSEKWSGFVENQGYKSDFYADSILRGGAAFLFQKNFQIDASISTNFKSTPSILYGGMGLSWRFEKNYKPTKLKTQKTGKAEKTKKDKNPQRKDAVTPAPEPKK